MNIFQIALNFRDILSISINSNIILPGGRPVKIIPHGCGIKIKNSRRNEK